MTIHVLDTSGMRCPLPIIKMAQLAKTLPSNDIIEILSTDPAAEYDIVAWSRMTGNACSLPNFTEAPWTVRYRITIT